MGAGEGSWPCRSRVTWVSPLPDHAAECQTPGFNHSSQSLLGVPQEPVLKGPKPHCPSLHTSFSYCVFKLAEGGDIYPLDIPFHTVCPRMSLVTATCQFYRLISICPLFTIPAVYTSSQATLISCLDPTLLGTLHSYTLYVIRGCLKKYMLSSFSCPEPF